MNAYDSHAAAHRIAAKLKDEGWPDWGMKIMDAMKYSATGTEILMKLRWTIQQFLKEAATCQPETLHMMQELLQKTDSLVK